MKKLFWTGLFCIWLAGCAPSHYLRQDGRTVRLFLHAPAARSVALADSSDGFRTHAAHRNGDGWWSVARPAGAPFAYFYLVDGRVVVPDCKAAELDDFGGRNCLFLP